MHRVNTLLPTSAAQLRLNGPSSRGLIDVWGNFSGNLAYGAAEGRSGHAPGRTGRYASDSCRRRNVQRGSPSRALDKLYEIIQRDHSSLRIVRLTVGMQGERPEQR